MSTTTRRWALRFSVAYLLAVAFGSCWIWLDTEDRSLPTIFLFGPRWVAALPMIFMVPLLALSRSWWCFAIVVLSALGIAGPLMGGRISVTNQLEPPPAYARYRVMTWNAGGLRSTSAFRKFLEETHPNIVLMQESPPSIVAADFPAGLQLVDSPGGVRMASGFQGRFQEAIGTDSLPLPGNAARFVLDTPDGLLTVYNLHPPTIRPGIEEAVHSKLLKLGELRTILPLQAKASNTIRNWVGIPIGMTVIAGDFNMPVESATYRRDWALFQNAFSEAGNGFGGTKMTSWHRVRIDHILYGSPFHCRHCFVGPDLGSDHRPVIADLTLEDGVK